MKEAKARALQESMEIQPELNTSEMKIFAAGSL
jgi:hypothetical protein